MQTMRGLKKLDIFISKQFLLLFAGTFLISEFVLVMQFLWRYVDELIGKGLTLDIMAHFVWYMCLMLIPQALPLAILLSSLIAFGNLGESSELTAIKASGVSLMQAFRPLIVIVLMISAVSFYFQNIIAPNANKSFAALLISTKLKNPELEIPEGIFYSGIPNCNIYVEKKDMQKGMLYGIMIYRMSSSFEDAAIILADSGKMEMTAEKKHLKFTLYSGEWFENMRSQNVSLAANVPYRREGFGEKQMLVDFDATFQMQNEDDFNADARSKGLTKILHDIDSINAANDSVGRAFFAETRTSMYDVPILQKKDSLEALAQAATDTVDFIKDYKSLTNEQKQAVVFQLQDRLRWTISNMEFRASVSKEREKYLRKHELQAVAKFTMTLSCLLFFFIGAPLGAIIRKGGLGVPVIVSVFVYIVYYIFENSGTKMARDGAWPVWIGSIISTIVLIPLAIFFTYKANKDSAVFNKDFYKRIMQKIFGIKEKRYIAQKEVIINDPDYEKDVETLCRIGDELQNYVRQHKLYMAPNIVTTFFKTQIDTTIININDELEAVIEDLSNTKYNGLHYAINHYPVINPDAHTSPFRKNWMNILTACILPIGIFFYFRIWRFRLTLLHDIRTIIKNNELTLERIRMFTDKRI